MLATSTVRPLGRREYLFDSEIPFCVTSGLLRPTIYISSAAVDALGSGCVVAALAHERGHVSRHETRARFVAAVAAAFHVPGHGRSLLLEWQHDSEFVCDQFAARGAGSATIVAEALVRFQRAMLRSQAAPIDAGACLCAQESTLHARVSSLLSSDPSDSDSFSDSATAYVLGVAFLILGGALQAPRLHHVIESLVGALGSLVA